jgi:hypothetical protein
MRTSAATNEPRRVIKSIKQGGFALPLDTPPMEAASAATLAIEGGPWQYDPKWD